ncbi:MAG: type II toxin-antitoxin system Phd/YefM family antitoxin [Acidobacteriia bacterium]|nr:type II toxin-antitoxin system Phd/YefM family antitoxin [Terriglobia bacterium]
MDIVRDIQPLTSFRRKSAEAVRRLKTTRRPMVLTINGKAELVVQDAAAYQRLLDIAAQADAREGIRQGLEDVSQGRTRPARDVFNALRREYGIPR